MEKIKNKFIIYKTLRAYEEAYNREDINDDSIVFVIEDHSIHTHGYTFGDGYDHNKGFFDSVDKLPKGEAGDWAGVMEDGEWYMYYYNVPSGWTNSGKYNISSLTPDILNQYIKKTNIRDYLKDIYNNVYVRKDEVYTPDQDWPTEYDESKNWRWDEEGNLYLIDTELDTESENAVSNKVISRALNTKVDINNYRNDTRNINNQIESLSNSLNTLIGLDDVTSVIDTFSEVVEFLNSIEDTTLIGLLNQKQNVIEDLEDIRSGSQKGSTAYQKPETNIPYEDLSSSVQNSLNLADTALQQHLSLDNYYTKDEIDSNVLSVINQEIAERQEKDRLIEDDLTQHIQDEVRHVRQEDKDAWNRKYDKPESGIPELHLSDDVLNSLGLARTSLQEHLSLSDYYTKSKVDTFVSEIGTIIDQEQYNRDNQDRQIDDRLTSHIQDEVRHVTQDDKNSWSNKYDKPQSGIPKSDLSQEVKDSLDLANSALQEHQSLNGYATEQWVLDLNFLSAIEDLEDIRSKANTALLEHLSLSGYATEQWVENKNYQPLISDLSDIRSGASAGATAYQKPSAGIPKSDLDNSVKNSLNKADTAIQSLADYYTKGQVDGLLDAINQFDYTFVDTLPTASSETMYKIYLIPNDGSEDQNIKDEYITTKSGDVYRWERFGTTAVSLANYYTIAEAQGLIDLKLNKDDVYTPGQDGSSAVDGSDDAGYDPSSSIVPSGTTDSYATWNRVLSYIDDRLQEIKAMSIEQYNSLETIDDNAYYLLYE